MDTVSPTVFNLIVFVHAVALAAVAVFGSSLVTRRQAAAHRSRQDKGQAQAKRARFLAAMGCGLLPIVAHALDEELGRLKLVDGAAQWRLISRGAGASALLDQGVSGSIPSATVFLAFRPDGSQTDQLVMVVRASTGGGSGRMVSWTQACDSSANMVAKRMTQNFNLPDCIKLSGNLVADKFASTSMPVVAQASARGELKLPPRARYFNILVGLESGSFASVNGLLDSKTPGADEWVQGFAEALRRGNLSLRGTVDMPAPPSLAAQR
jgi:hypothetical protein